jgi:molybdopterin molybdotransferase
VKPSRSWENPDDMIGVDEARERILAHFHALEARSVPLLDAAGLVAASDIVATVAVPPFRNSAMDGYAVRAADAQRAPVSLRVVDHVAAGAVAARSLQAGEAIRIMTGAQMPEGADAVVRFEETDEVDVPNAFRDRGQVQIRRAPHPHENVREAGEDLPAGAIAVLAGMRLGAAEIGILASLNIQSVPVHRRPVVGILATGDEVTDLGPPLEPGRIRNSNSSILATLVRRYGGEPLMMGVARDTPADLRESLARAGPVDLLVTSGGVSVGDFDVVKDVLQSEGAIEIWQVRMKPGKPLAFGTIGAKPLLGLPGNPVAALVSFEQFGRPALLKMLGRRDLDMPAVPATLTERLENRGRRRHFVRGVLEMTPAGFSVRSIRDQGSAVLTAVVRANCLIVVPETADVLDPGTRVEAQIPDPEAFFASIGARTPSVR